MERWGSWGGPYLGRLVGLPEDASRREVAYATALRRRKGTPGGLKDFAEVLTGFTARVVEGWRVTLWAQVPGHPAAPRISSLSLRDRDLLRVGTPFERAARSVSPQGPRHPRAAAARRWPWQA